MKAFVTNENEFLKNIQEKKDVNLNNEVVFSNFSDEHRGEYYRISYLVSGQTSEYINADNIQDIIQDFEENYK